MEKKEIAKSAIFLLVGVFGAVFAAFMTVYIVSGPSGAPRHAAVPVDPARAEAVRSLKETWQKLQDVDIASTAAVCSSVAKWYTAGKFESMISEYSPEPADNFDFEPTDLMAVKYEIAKVLVPAVINSNGLIDCGDGLAGVMVVEAAMEAGRDNGIVVPDESGTTNAGLRRALIRQVKPFLATPNREIVTGRTVADVVRQYGLTAAELKR